MLAICLLPLILARPATAHEEMIGPLLVVEKVFKAPPPIGRITVRYDATDEAAPALHLRSDLFHSEIPPAVIQDLPRPDWAAITVPFSLVEFDTATGQWIDRPYLYIAIPLHGPQGATWPATTVQLFFDEDATLKERRLRQFVPLKDGNPRLDLSPADADAISTLSEPWPLDSELSAQKILSRALHRQYPADQ